MTDDPAYTRNHLLHRAVALGAAAAVGGSIDVASVFAAPASRLVLTPEQEEGPFYVALNRIRKNITLGKPGVPLHLRINVETTTGKPVARAACDIWHADATGVYSDEGSEGTVGRTWCRGVQLTNGRGIAEFVTIYPGFYQGRTTHIHVKVHTGGHVSHTGQLFFADAVSTKVYALAPYNTETVSRTTNATDGIYTGEGGSKSMLALTRLGTGIADGFLGAITLVVDPAATPAAVGR